MCTALIFFAFFLFVALCLYVVSIDPKHPFAKSYKNNEKFRAQVSLNSFTISFFFGLGS